MGLAIAWQFLRVRPGFEPVILATIPWIIAHIEGRPPVLRTRVDPWIFLFAATLLLGYWAAYNQVVALSRFWLILLAIVVFYIVAKQPLRRIWSLFDLGSLFGVFIATSFILSNLVRLVRELLGSSGIINALTRPLLRIPQLQPNIAGGLIALFLPLTIASIVYAVSTKQREKAILRAIVAGFLLIGLLLTSSRGAWFALAFGILVGAVVGYLEWSSGRLRFVWIAGILLPLTLIVGIWGFANANDQIPILIDSVVPGAASAQSRVQLARQGISLLADAPFTGIGLGSFPGQYSRYILVISEFFYGYAHNLFLDIALSQSPFGLLGFLAIMIVSVGVLLTPASLSHGKQNPIAIIRSAILASMIIILVHGLIDDPIYSGRGAVFLLFIPGLAMVNLKAGNEVEETPKVASMIGESRFASVTPLWVILSGLSIALVLLAVSTWPSLTSVWESNLASIKQARSDLVQRIVFDINKFPNDPQVEQSLLSSIELDEKNRTAYHRLGMLSFRHGEFDQAARYLEIANRLDPEHPGIEKALGYAYTWKGEFDQAYDILREYPETVYELGLYAQWWLTQDRTDLANYAVQVETMLGE